MNDLAPADGSPSDGSPSDVAVMAANAAYAKGGLDPVIIDVAPILGICDVFVVVTATNDRQVKAITDHVQAELADRFGRRPRSIEGTDARRWVLLDYGDVVVHVFQTEERSTYRLERLYVDADRIDWRTPEERTGSASA